MLKTVLMYVLTFSGICLLGYVRICGASRVKQHPEQSGEGWTPREKKLLYIAMALIALGLIFTLFVK